MANGVLRFLIVDDHVPTRIALRDMVTAHPGWDVIAEAADGRTAVALVMSQQPNLVLMDIAMPRMNGIQATRQIKALAAGVHVILFSAYANRSFRHGSMEAGADYFIRKEELTAQVLGEIVTNVLDQADSQNEGDERQ